MCPIRAWQQKHLRGDPGEATPREALSPAPGAHVGRKSVILQICVPDEETVWFLVPASQPCQPLCSPEPVFSSEHHTNSPITYPALKDAPHPGAHTWLTACSPRAAHPSSCDSHATADRASPQTCPTRHLLVLITPYGTSQDHRLPNTACLWALTFTQ